MQLPGGSRIWRFLSSLSAPGRPAHPAPCRSWNFPCAAPGLRWDGEMESHRRPQRRRPCKPAYRRRARRPGPGASSTAGSRLAPPGPGRAPRRSAALAAPGASARGPSACTGRHSRSRGSRTPRCTGELKNSGTALSRGRAPGAPTARGPALPCPARRKSPQGRGHGSAALPEAGRRRCRVRKVALSPGHTPQRHRGLRGTSSYSSRPGSGLSSGFALILTVPSPG